MLQKAAIDKIIPLLKKHSKRALKMHVHGFPHPYFASFLLRDIESFNTWASNGSMYRRNTDRSRYVYSDVRVGNNRYDQVSDGGLYDNDEELESYNFVKVPVDDRVYDGLIIALWRLSETKFREALVDYNQRESAGVSRLDPNRKFYSYVPAPKTISIKYARPEVIDEEKWARFCKETSRWMSELPNLSSSFVDFTVTQESKVFVSTENSVIVQHSQVFTLSAMFQKLTTEGSQIEQEVVINVGTQKELPSIREFKKLALTKYDQLQKLVRAKRIHAFSGPVLLYPGPAGLLFHEAIGHRLEGNRLLSTGEGQTFKNQEEKRILNVDLTIRDYPRLKEFQGKKCIGAFDFDDEGMPARNALLVDRGILKGFLNSRAASSEKYFTPNGHARNSTSQRPISRMGVTIIKGRKTVPLELMRAQLIEEIKRQGKPFGMIVYETSGGETETTRYDFQAFSGEISFATLIYANGKEVVIRGVNFVGTPLQALNNIIAVSEQRELDNGYCGAESGMIPVTTISPGVLLSNLELQAKDEELVTPFLLRAPRI
jgi:predicted Zn-dependent protease